MKIDGSCHCGQVTYEAEVNPDKVGICHCTDCQTLSGSAFRTAVPTPEADFKLLTGELKTYIKTANNGNLRPQVFCPECGSQIYATSLGDGPKVFNLRVGTIHQRDQLKPRFQIWRRSAQDWVDGLASIRKIERQ